MITILAALAALLIAQPASAQLGKVFPVDEASTNPSFLEFRTQLLGAVQKQDTAFVLSCLDSEIESGSGEFGIPYFEEQWFRMSYGRDIWRIMEDILTHGGSCSGDTGFAAPYWSSDMSSRYFDPYFHRIIIGEAVQVKSGPGTGSVLAVLSHDIVADPPDRYRMDDLDRRDGWTAIMLRDSTVGYVPSAEVRKAISYRMSFQFKGGRWLIIGLYHGD